MEPSKPIVDMRAVEHTWTEDDPQNADAVIRRYVHRIEIKREGDVEWKPLELIENTGRPDWSRI
jgi:hypothetical protein